MKKVWPIIMTLFGTAITAFAISVFLTPNKIVGGGVSGISTILYQSLKIPVSVSFGAINLVLLLFGLKRVGKDFFWRTIFGAGALTVFVEIFSHIQPLTDNLMLATLFGGALYGLGIGIAFASGASTGGTDILGRIIQSFFPQFPVGEILRFVDGIIIFVSFLVFRNTELVLYGVIALLISTFTVDYLIGRLNVSKMVFVITDRGTEIAKMLVGSSPRGVTIINVVGAYTMTDKQMLYCVMKAQEVPKFQEKILEVDPTAFIVYSQSQQIQGNGFHLYR